MGGLIKCSYLANDDGKVYDTFLLVTTTPGGLNKFTTEPFLIQSGERQRVKQAMGERWPRGSIHVRLSGRNDKIQDHKGGQGLEVALILGLLGKHPRDTIVNPLRLDVDSLGAVVEAYVLGAWHQVCPLEYLIGELCE